MSLSGVPSTPVPSRQVSRWTFTVNNYDIEHDYKKYLLSPSFNIKRSVWGYEVAPETSTRHLQGYVEFNRSKRLGHCKKIFPTGHWECAISDSLTNFQYCTKSGSYDFVGDFSKEIKGEVGSVRQKLGLHVVIRALLKSECASQIKVTREYADCHGYFDKISSYIKDIRKKNELFNEWQSRKLYLWQYNLLVMIMRQSDREVLWVVDRRGNRGKTYFCKFLTILYGFMYFDGVVNSRDIVPMLKEDVQGFCFDVSRAALPKFDYAVLENLKNGLCSSGKYRGATVSFKPVPVAIFANEHPRMDLLSDDRWKIVVLGSGDFSNLEGAHAIVSPDPEIPFVKPLPVPDLNESFDMHSFLVDHQCETPVEIYQPTDGSDNPMQRNVASTSVPPVTISPIASAIEHESAFSSQPPPVIRRPNVGIVIGTPPIRNDRQMSSSLPETVAPFTRSRPLICPMHGEQGTYRKGCPCQRKGQTSDRGKDGRIQSTLDQWMNERRTVEPPAAVTVEHVVDVPSVPAVDAPVSTAVIRPTVPSTSTTSLVFSDGEELIQSAQGEPTKPPILRRRKSSLSISSGKKSKMTRKRTVVIASRQSDISDDDVFVSPSKH